MFIYKTQNLYIVPVGRVETNTDTGLQRLGKLLSRQDVVFPDTRGIRVPICCLPWRKIQLPWRCVHMQLEETGDDAAS